ncbi:MAG TPA: beta-galactosidase GalA [Opitutaceae bacterium]
MNTASRRLFVLLAALALGLAPHRAAAEDTSQRERLLMDFGWKFHLGNEWGGGYGLAKAGTAYGPGTVSYSDASWRKVDLPHDWAIELPFDPAADAAHGYKPVGEGFPQNSTAWYRRTFELPKADAGKRLWLEFDGVYRDATIIVNGWFVAHHEGGYNSFRCDITDVANCGGRNVVSVKVDASQAEGWFYEGAGIYRHVWLVKTAPVAVAPDGVFALSIFKDNIPNGPAEVHVQTRIVNAQEAPADATVTWQFIGPDGKVLDTQTQTVQLHGGGASVPLDQRTMVNAPQLWSPETPVLYRVVTRVWSGGLLVDRVETEFGIRTVAFDADRGFLLNGAPYTLKGTSNHQDHAGVGSALPDGVQYFRIARLKEMGCNAYRTAHNPPTAELLDACDRLGMIVMDENRQLGSDPRHVSFLEEQIRRDRNHPSVCIWSLGNEEFDVQGTQAGRRVVATMQELVKRLDPTRPVTCNAAVGDDYPGINEAIEVRGWSYHVGKDMDAYHKEHPLQPNVGSEQGSTVSTRGIYANDKLRGYVSAYDDNAPEWAQTAETWVTFFAPRPWMSGGFVWTGFDYRGEPTPYAWPCINSHFGILDTCGFPKDNFWYYKAWWTDAPVLHLLPHWNWAGREGQEIDVRALSNCDEVELFLNGRSMGRQAMKRDSELKWKVAYAPGTLSAVGYKDGKEVADTKVETTGAPASVQLKPDHSEIDADGEAVAVFTVSVADAQGRVIPTADAPISLNIEGPGRIVGVGNGDPSSHEPDTFIGAAASSSAPVAGWRWKKIADPYPENLAEEGEVFDDASWAPIDISGDTGQLGYRERAIYRSRFSVSSADLSSPVIELVMGKVAGGIAVYVNGHKVGSGSDGRTAAIYDVKALLHPGENVVAVTTASYGPDATGLSKGASLRYQGAPAAVHWSRSTFNGLAEVIVQSSKDPGTIVLTAASDGLQTATFPLASRAAKARPALP